MRQLIDKIISFFAKLKKNKVLKQTDVKLNLGAGLQVAPNWINIDGSYNAFFSKFPVFFLKKIYKVSGANKYYSENEYVKILKENKFIHHELKYGIPFQDNSCDFIFSSHFLEHLPLYDANHLLREMFRCVKDKGVVRITIPDLEYAVELYKKGKKDDFLKFFFTETSNIYEHHHYMYDFEMLEKRLKKAGFKKIHKRNYKEGSVPNIDILDNRPEETLFIEALK